MKLSLLLIPAALAVGVAAPAGALAAEVTLNVVADTTLSESDVNNNLGGHGFVMSGRALGSGSSGRRRALLRFDTSTIPPGSRIDSATLSVDVPLGRGGAAGFGVHRLLLDWGEGTKGNPSPFGGGFLGNLGSPASAGEATWNSRKHAEDDWSDPGAVGDHVTAASATTLIDTGGQAVWTGSGLAEDVAFWAANPGLNFGWIVVGQSEDIAGIAKRLGSREGGNGAVLNVRYTPPALLSAPEPLASGGFRFVVATEPGADAVVETSMNLIDWTPFFTNAPTAASFVFTNTNALALPRRFFRVTRPPAEE